jgi:hypothetical protein
MKPTLNQNDVELLKSIFATKEDLSKFATKEDLTNFSTKDDLKPFATKDDLNQLEKRQNFKFDQLEGIVSKSFEEIETNFSDRISRLEEEVGISPPLPH